MDEQARKIDPRPKVCDPDTRIGQMLEGSRGRVVGVANEHFHRLWLRRQAARLRRRTGRRLVDIAEVGRVVAFLVGGGASGMTGDTIYVDGGLHNFA